MPVCFHREHTAVVLAGVVVDVAAVWLYLCFANGAFCICTNLILMIWRCIPIQYCVMAFFSIVSLRVVFG